MNSYMRHGVSSVALLAGLSFAYAQTAEHQGKESGGATTQHMQSERSGKESGAQHQGNATERGKANGTGRQGLAQGQGSVREERGQQAEKGGQAQREENGRQTQRDTRGHRTAKNAPSEEQQEQTKQREGERAPQGNQPGQRESHAGSTGKSEELRHEGERSGQRTNIHISGTQKTELHDAIAHETGIHRLHRGDVHFSLEAGSRVPDGVEFYDPPRRFVDIDPEFRGYKVIVLDDEILIIDPATREIVDVIPT